MNLEWEKYTAFPCTSAAILSQTDAFACGAQWQWQLGNYHERKIPDICLSPCDGLKAAAVGGGDFGQVTCVLPTGCSIGGNASCYNEDAAAAVQPCLSLASPLPLHCLF